MFRISSLLSALCAVLFANLVQAAGTGLTGSYFNNKNFTGSAVTRADAGIDFIWTGAPGPAGIGADNFSVRWDGQIEALLSENYTFYVTADDGARLWVDDQLLVGRTNFSAANSEIAGSIRLEAGRRYNLRVEFIENSGTATARLAWSSASTPKQIVPAAQLYPTTITPERGSILMEQWNGIAGTAVNALTTSANYPAKPSERDSLLSFECLAQNVADDFGTKVSGFLVPAVSGSYTFAVAASDSAELWLSTDASVANKVKVVQVTSATAFRQFTNTSGAITLAAGTKYYVELLHKAGTGADHFSVAWKPPGAAAFEVISADSLVPSGLTTAQPAQGSFLNTLATGHPRVLISRARMERLRSIIAAGSDAKVTSWWNSVLGSANSILPLPVNTYVLDSRDVLLGVSRSVLDRVYKLSLAYEITGDAQYAERAWAELDAAANFPDWHPPHFLDVAEMTHAFAIGYDWLYEYWSAARRTELRNAIRVFGLNEGVTHANDWFFQSTANNWNLVCTGGLTLGALAIGNDNAADAATVESVLNNCVGKVASVMKHYTADNGGWYEGPGYWDFATEYNARMMCVLETALGSDFNLSDTKALWQTGQFPAYITGPTHVSFNYADSGAGNLRGCQLFWFARRFNKPEYAWYERTNGSGEVLDLLWYDTRGTNAVADPQPLDIWFRGATAETNFNTQDVVTMRSAWENTNATFLATKAGETGASHGDLEAGTFVLDALGVRWASDLGSDDYGLAGYFSEPQRWTYYRLRAEGNNTLVINPGSGADQVDGSISPVVTFATEPNAERAATVMDLTAAYAGATKVARGFQLFNRRKHVLVQDEIAMGAAANVWWFMHIGSDKTVAIEPDGSAVMLTKGSARMWLKIVSGGGAFQLMDAVPLPTSPNPAGQNANTGQKKLAIHLTGVTNTTLAVYAVPLSAGENPPATLPVIVPLANWAITGNSAPIAAGGGANGPEAGPVDVELRNYASDGETPPDQLRFAVSGAVNGTVALLADGHTARFLPTSGYVGIPTFDYTATDAWPDPRMLLAYDFDGPDFASAPIAPDVSRHLRDGTIDLASTGTFSLVNDKPAQLGGQGARSIDLVENTTTAARVQRVVTVAELDWNAADWSVAGWFKRRDTANDDIVWHLSDGDGFGSNNEIYVNCPTGSNSVRLQHFAGAAYDVDIVQNGIAPGVWHHFAVVRSGATISFYVNGALAGTDNAFTFALDQNSPVVFGGHASPAFQPARWFDGQLDDCAVFAGGLSAGEVATLAGGMTVRHFGGASASGTILIGVTPTTINWTATGTAAALAWSSGGNWATASAPASSRGATLDFLTGQTLGAGTVISQNDNAGGFTIGTLTLGGTSSGAAAVLITGNALTFTNNGATNPVVNLNASAGSGLTYEIATALTLATTTTFQGSGSATFLVSGDVSGAGGLVKTGTSKLILAGTNSYAGLTTISGGTLQIGNDGAIGSLGAGDVVNNATLRFDRTGTLLVPNDISGTGGVTIDCPISAGTIVFSGSNSFAGSVNVSSGALRITNSSALGTGTKTITLSNGTAGNPQLRLDGSAGDIALPATFTFTTSNNTSGAIINEAGNNTIGGNFNLTGGGGNTKIIAAAGTLTLNGNLAPITTSRSLDLGGAGGGVINGNVADGVSLNVLGVIKSDAGIWTLNGVNAWTGSTSVNAGTFVVNGSLMAGGTVTVASAARLSGSGTIAANTTVSGTHAPGDGLGGQTFTGTLSYGSASHLAWELGASVATGPSVDRVNAAGVSVTTNAAIDVVLNRAGSAVNFADPFWGQARTWTVLTASTMTGTFKLGTVSADSAGRAVTGFGAFAIQNATTGAYLVWTPAAPFQQWQAANFGVNWNNASIAGSTANPDRDAWTNAQEYVLGFNPQSNETSAPLVAANAGGNVTLTFLAKQAAGLGYTSLTRFYDLEMTTDIANAASWTGLAGQTNIVGANQTVIVTQPLGGLPRFFRLKVRLQ